MLKSRIRGTSPPLPQYSRAEHCLSLAIFDISPVWNLALKCRGFICAGFRLESDAVLFRLADCSNTWIGLSEAHV